MHSSPRSATRGSALVTGASGGIGYELSKFLARDGYDLALVARSRPNLERVAGKLRDQYGVAVRVLAQDLSAPGAAEAIAAELKRDTLPVDILVNNAGYGGSGPFAASDEAELLGMLQVNIVALTQLTRRFLPAMIERRSGKVLNVASTAAFTPGPLMAVYYASKAYVLSFSQAISNELRGTGVTVTALVPGPTATDFQRRAGVERARLFRIGLTMDAGEVARIGYAGLLAGRRVVIPGLANRALALGTRIVPAGVAAGLARRLHEGQ